MPEQLLPSELNEVERRVLLAEKNSDGRRRGVRLDARTARALYASVAEAEALREELGQQDQEKDDLRMRVVTAEVGAEKADKALQAARAEFVAIAEVLEKWLAGDAQSAAVAKLAARIRKFVE